MLWGLGWCLMQLQFHDVKLYLYFPCKGPKWFLVIRSDRNQKEGWNYLFLVITTCISEGGTRKGFLKVVLQSLELGICAFEHTWRRRKGDKQDVLGRGAEVTWLTRERDGLAGEGVFGESQVADVGDGCATSLAASSPKPDGRTSSSSLELKPFVWLTVTHSQRTG